jgi:FkbM family methyltransferase
MTPLTYSDKYQGDRFWQEVFKKNVYNLGLNIIDVGALAGEFSFWVSPYAKNVYAMEPEKSQYEELEWNIKDYEFKNVIPFHLAIGKTNGVTKVVGSSRGGYVTDQNTKDPNAQEVELKTLATFIKENNIDYVDILKIDIENGELDVFTADDFNEVSDKIHLIIGEHLDSSQPILENMGFVMIEHNNNNKIFKRMK